MHARLEKLGRAYEEVNSLKKSATESYAGDDAEQIDLLEGANNIIEIPLRKNSSPVDEAMDRSEPKNVIDLESKRIKQKGRLRIPRNLDLRKSDHDIVIFYVLGKESRILPIGDKERHKLKKDLINYYGIKTSTKVQVLLGPVDSLSEEILKEDFGERLVPVHYFFNHENDELEEKLEGDEVLFDASDLLNKNYI